MHDFIRTIFYWFRQAIPPALIGLAIGAVLLVLLNRKYRQKGIQLPKGQAAAVLLLLCYLGGLVAITFMNRVGNGMQMYQLYPFLAFWEAWNAFTLQVWLNPLLNIAMFVPLGMFLPLAAKTFRRWYWMLAAGAGISLIIEAAQYTLGRGQADVDDLICNTLGAMLGYCLCMLFVSLSGKRWKTAGAYALLPALSIVALTGVFLAYRFQPYGNLEEPFTAESCDAFAVDFLGRQGAEINFGGPDVNYYDNSTFYSDHRTYNLIINHNDRSYEYTDYRVDSDLRYSDKGGRITEDELRTALGTLGIDVPDAAQFVTVDEERGEYAFRAECVVEDGVLTAGELICHIAEGGMLYEVDNALSVSTLHGNATVISSQEAYDLLCAGRFSWQDVPMFNYLKPNQVRVTACALEYMADSKGFRQPVYVFTLSDDRDAELRSGNGWTTFVPALSRS